MAARETIIPVFVPHLGCPNNCVFCNQHHISGEKKPADAETVFAAVEAAEGLVPPDAKRELAFYGGSFTAIPADNRRELLEAAGKLYECGKIDSIRLSTRPDAISEDILDELRLYPVEIIELGAQSLDEDVLLKSGRGHSAEAVYKASELVKSRGFGLILQFMTGLPGDSDEKDILTAEKIIGIKPDGVRIYPTVIIKDTPLYSLWKKGIYKEHTVEDAVRVCSRIVPLFDAAGIPIIRLGLNPSDELSAGEAAGGAYHPALGELVRSRIFRKRAEDLLCGVPAGAKVILGVNRSCISQMTGQHRCNIEYLKELYALSALKVVAADAKPGDVAVISAE